MKLGWVLYAVFLGLICAGAGYYQGYEDGREKGQKEAWNRFADELDKWRDKTPWLVPPPKLPRYE